MDLAKILKELAGHKGWLMIGALVAVVAGLSTAYRPTLSPPGLESKSLERGAAATSVVVDSRRSTIIDLAGEVEPLAARAQTYARLAASRPVRQLMAEAVDVPAGAISASSSGGGEPGAEERGSDIAEEGDSYRVFFTSLENQPLIDIASLGPTGKAAADLANGAARGLAEYVEQQQEAQGIPPNRRVVVRQVGIAEGSLLNSGANKVAVTLVGLAAFIGFSLLILLASRVRADLRRLDRGEVDDPFASHAPHSNGSGELPAPPEELPLLHPARDAASREGGEVGEEASEAGDSPHGRP